MNANSKSPCYNCKNRTMTCHNTGNCQAYGKYQEQCRQASQKQRMSYYWWNTYGK